MLIRAWREKTAREEALARMVKRITCAQEEERRRIACDLHDGIAQLVVSAEHHLETCAELWHRDREQAREELGKGIDRLQGAIVDTRRVLMTLRPSAIDSVGLVPALRGTVSEAAQERGWLATFLESP